MASWDPRAFLQTIPLPVNQIIEPLTPPPRAEESPDFVSRGAINNTGGRRGTGGGLEPGQNKRFETGDVEGGMNFKGAG